MGFNVEMKEYRAFNCCLYGFPLEYLALQKNIHSFTTPSSLTSSSDWASMVLRALEYSIWANYICVFPFFSELKLILLGSKMR